MDRLKCSCGGEGVTVFEPRRQLYSIVCSRCRRCTHLSSFLSAAETEWNALVIRSKHRKPDWISVADDLPAEDDPVLVTDGSDRDVATLQADGSFVCRFNFADSKAITHWRPWYGDDEEVLEG